MYNEVYESRIKAKKRYVKEKTGTESHKAKVERKSNQGTYRGDERDQG